MLGKMKAAVQISQGGRQVRRRVARAAVTC